MRIAQINSYSNGSTGHIARTIHTALLERGHESLFAFGAGPDIGPEGYRIETRMGGFLHTLITLFTGLHGYSSAAATRRLVRRLKVFQPDLIHLHNLHGSYLNLKILFRHLKRADIPVVMTVHDCWVYTGKCYHYYEAKCDKFLRQCGDCPQLAMYPKSYYFDCTKKMLADKKKWIGGLKDLHIVTISQWLQGEVGRSMLGHYPITIVRNSVHETYGPMPVPEAVLDKYGLRNKFVILGVASSWNAHKGVDDFCALAERLAEDEVIVLVGHMKEGTQLPANIVTVPRTESVEELAQLYNAASVYISMSTEETFGLTIAEALCCGTPAVVYDATACPEMVQAEQNGYAVPPHDVERAYECIQRIKHGSVADRATISEQAQGRYATRRMVDEYLAVYKGVLE